MQILSVRGAAAPATSPTSWPKNLAIPGPEDFVIDRAAHIAYLSSQDRSGSEAVMGGLLRMKANRWEVRGSIYQMDLNDPDLSLWQLADDFPKNKGFHPVGMDLHVNPDGSRRLFIVNWPGPNQYAVEIFDLETNRLRHVRTVAGKALTCPNDIAAVDGERFYVSNSLSLHPSLQQMEQLLGLPTGTVVYHDPDEAELQVVATGITYANGIALDRRRGRIYVASFTNGRILEFFWDPLQPTAPLRRCSALTLDFLPDNLVWEDENTLWVAGSQFLSGLFFMLQLSDRAPSYVARIALASPDLVDQEPLSRARPEMMYRDDGGEIPACSVAAPYELNGERRLIIGSCFADHALVSLTSPAP
ncbi:MAG: SMP-30/gluconolactonase/LRE family protein [Candidatus Accumulibacter sp. UW20]|jgi:arylesterase/paraoxonase